MSRPRVLLVDDDPMQLRLSRIRLRDAGFEVEIASSANEAFALAKREQPDLIVSDVIMDELDGFGFCRRLREEPAFAEVPVILLSAHYRGREDQELAAHVGAYALVTRTPEFDAELDTIRESLAHHRAAEPRVSNADLFEEHLRTNATQLAKLEREARSAEQRYRTLFENANDTVTLLTPEGVVIEANQRWREVIGVDPETMVGHHVREFAAHGHEDTVSDGYRRHVELGRLRSDAVPLRRPDGSTVYMEFSSSTITVGGKPTVLSIGRDVTKSVLAMHALAEAEERYRSLVERLPDIIWTCTIDGALTFMTPNVVQILGRTAAQLIAEDFETRTSQIHPEDRARAIEAFRACAESGTLFDIEFRRQHDDGRWLWLRNRAIATYEKDGVRYVEGMMTDITDRKRLEESFRQAQKMEAIGQLTGGIAHDFNNILAAILANSHFLAAELSERDPRRADAIDIKEAAERAAALTRQLLAFSRRQVLEPTVADLNATVSALEKMLRRLISEDIEFSVVAAPQLGTVRVDVGQLEQVVLNLVVNARDAMATGGKLTIETANVDLDENAAAQVGATRGRYVMLAVSDTGCGMDAETKRRIFEPFFTTKEPGKGTGLGLSTCYGIVRQSGGAIWVYTELGRGTVFKIYLPRVDDVPTAPTERATVPVLDGTETILLVEDDPRVRTAVTRMLEARGYTVLVARNGIEAVEIARTHSFRIDLVVSDVIMPGANGPEVVARIRERTPSVRALFMSGYTDHAVLSDPGLGAGANFVQKPFAPEALARKVREALGQPEAQSGDANLATTALPRRRDP